MSPVRLRLVLLTLASPTYPPNYDEVGAASDIAQSRSIVQRPHDDEN
jgi:hypothetical protein